MGGSRVAALKGITCPEVSEANHVGQIVIDLVGCADIKFVTDVFGDLVNHNILVHACRGETRLDIKFRYRPDTGEDLQRPYVVRIVGHLR